MRIKQDNASNIGRPRVSGGRPSFGSCSSAGSSRKRPVSRFRMGPATTSRRSSASSIRGNFGHDVIKENRPLKDKSYMQREIQDIIQFLQEYNFSHQVTTKQLMNPTTKDFLRIFEFVYSFLNPNYKMANKHEEEIPQILKSLKYPFTLSKTAMFSLGSPHTWPHILGALHWLTEIVKFAMHVDVDQLLFSSGIPQEMEDDFQELTESEVLFRFVDKTYAEFMAGKDSFEDLEQELEQNLKRATLGIAGDMEDLALEEKRLQNELHQLEQEPNQLSAAREKYDMVKLDNEKFDKFLKDLENHGKGLEQKYEDADLLVQQKELELSQLDQEKCSLEQQLANQKLSAVDVQRIQTEARMLNTAIDQTEKENQAVDKACWDEERKIAKSQEELEKNITEYNSLARNSKLISADAENAHGIDFEMRHSFGDQSMANFIHTIKPSLQQLKRRVCEETNDINNQKLLEEERLDELNEIIENKEAVESKLEKNIEKLDADIAHHKEKSKVESDTLTGQIAELESEMKMMMMIQEGGDVQKAQENLARMKESFERRTAEMDKEKEDYRQFLLKAATLVLEHKTKIQEHFQNLTESGKEHMENMKKLQLPEGI